MAGAYDKRALLVIVWVLSVALTQAQQTQSCSWVLYANTLIYSGTENPANSLAACQAACIATSGCVGVDWAPGNTAGTQCFLQNTQSGKQSPVQGVSHYDYVCNVCTWVYYPNTLIYGGTPNPPNSLVACQTACLAISGCAGIDWAPGNTAGNQCFLQTSQSGKTPTQGVDHYDNVCNGTATTGTVLSTGTTISTASPTTSTTIISSTTTSTTTSLTSLSTASTTPLGCYWNVTNNTYIVGGTNNPATSLSACQAACANISAGVGINGCSSIDWLRSGTTQGFQCFLQTTQSGKTAMQGVDHYDFICPSPALPTRACRFSYELYANTSSLGGVQVQEITNIDNCNAACRRLSTCAGVDFSSVTGCWIHYNSSDFSQIYSQGGVTQQRFNRCPGDDLYSCNNLYNGSTLIDVCGSVCVPQWSIIDNAAGSGGQVTTTFQPQNLAGCLSYCFSTNSCIGVDYTSDPRSSPRCVYYTSAQQSALNNITRLSFSTQYRLDNNCTQNCSNRFQRNDNVSYHLINTWNLATVSNETDCLSACRFNSTCKAAQWTRAPVSQCVLATDFYDYSSTPNSAIVTHLRRITCPSTSPPATPTISTQTTIGPTTAPASSCQFVLYNNTLIYGGLANPANTLQPCMNACVATNSCQGIDWSPGNPAGQMCFIQYTQAGKVSTQPGVSHYDYVCNGSSSVTTTLVVSSTTTISTTTTPTTTTTTPTTVIPPSTGSTPNPSNCTWVPYNNTNIFGGSQIPANTLSACQNACIQNGTCQSIDWTPANPPGSQCYLLQTQQPKYTNSPGTIHYDYVCQVCWNLVQNTLIYNGVQNTAATSLSDCQAACLLQPFSSCQSIDWDTNFNQCFLHNTQLGRYTATGVNHYDRNNTC